MYYHEKLFIFFILLIGDVCLITRSFMSFVWPFIEEVSISKKNQATLALCLKCSGSGDIFPNERTMLLLIPNHSKKC